MKELIYFISTVILFIGCNNKKDIQSKNIESKEMPLGRWDMITVKNNNDTILFYPTDMNNRYIILKNDSLHDFNGQEDIVCRINNIYILDNKYHIVLESNCSYADTINFQRLADNLIKWNLYNGISFLSTNTSNKYKTVYESDLNKNNILEINHLSKNSDCSDLWYDIFYLYPFEESPDNIGNYYVQIEKEKISTFATSFGNKDIDFDYKVDTYCNNDTLFLFEEDSYEILGKIVKIGDNYFIKSDLIKVFSEDIKPEKYGYKLKKGYPEE